MGLILHHERPKDVEEIEDGHGHHHGHHHVNLNVKAAFIHILGDFFQSIGVLIASIIIWWNPSWSIADPICTFLFSIIVFSSTIIITKDILMILMEGTPSHIDPINVKSSLLEIKGVSHVHDLHIWTLAPGRVSATVHLIIANSQSNDFEQGGLCVAILNECQSLLRNKFKIQHITIQIEDYNLNNHCRSSPCETV